MMDERNTMLMNFMLNEGKHLRRFIECSTPFKIQKKGQKPLLKNLLKGQFLSFSKMIKQFRPFYFELYPNCLVKYQDKTKAQPAEQLSCQNCTVSEENEMVGEQVAFGIIIQNSEENEIAKLVTDKFQIHKVWLKALKKYCKIGNFLQRFKVENRIFDHFYRCIDKKKRVYVSVKIVNKKGLKPEQKLFVDNEIEVIRRVQCNLLPKLKKVYEDENYIYLTFAAFAGDDLLKIVCTSSLEEIAVATLTYHILKGLRSIHSQGAYHGNLKLENIIFSTGEKENEIFIINFKFIEENSLEYRDRLLKRGTNNYIAPEVIEGKEFDSQIDIFALGVCLYYMVFQKFPYQRIERLENNKWEYNLDISILEQMLNEKKKNPSSHQTLSVSGIDFLLKLLHVDPDIRPNAAMALNHHWFINFTNKPTENKKLQKFREAHEMTSLKTILECSEISEKEFESSRLFIRKPFASGLSNFGSGSNSNILTGSTLQNNILQSQMHNTFSLPNAAGNTFPIRNQLAEFHDDNEFVVSDEQNEDTQTVKNHMINLNKQTMPKCLHPLSRTIYSSTGSSNQNSNYYNQSPQQINQNILDNKNQAHNNCNSPLWSSSRSINNNNYNLQDCQFNSSPSISQKNGGMDAILEETSELKQSTTFRQLNSQTSKNPTLKHSITQSPQTVSTPSTKPSVSTPLTKPSASH